MLHCDVTVPAQIHMLIFVVLSFALGRLESRLQVVATPALGGRLECYLFAAFNYPA
ncbi:hypothetical protein D9M68_205510 [compost metagenome]